jgi:hypothetical protein
VSATRTSSAWASIRSLNPCTVERATRVTDFPAGGFFRGGPSCALPRQACAGCACLRLLSWLRVSTLCHRGVRVVPAHHLPQSSLPLPCLGLSRRPQGLAGWERGRGGEMPGCNTPSDWTENRVRCTPACVCACGCAACGLRMGRRGKGGWRWGLEGRGGGRRSSMPAAHARRPLFLPLEQGC